MKNYIKIILSAACLFSAAGCDGLIIEVHHDPDSAVCDGAQSLYPEQYDKLYHDIKKIAPIVDKKVI